MNNNVSLPKQVYSFLRTEFCNNLKSGTEGLIPCVIFGAEAVPGRALTFHVLRDDGALVSQLPLHALCHLESAPRRELGELLRWDCFGWWLTAIEFDYLREVGFETLIAGEPEQGQYVCTFDFHNNGYSEEPTQHKCLHLLALDDGNFSLQPNNNCKALQRSFVERPFDWNNLPAIELNCLKWYAEEKPQF